MQPRHIILDRDGVLNQEAPARGYVLEASMWRWIPGALDALAALTAAGVRLSVATNQSGVGRGLMTETALRGVHERMRDEAAAVGARIADIFVCPHAPSDGCDCRKPAAGLLHSAMHKAGIEARASLLIGDAQRDLEAASRAGMPAALVLTGKGREFAQQARQADIAVYEDLASAARAILSPTPEATATPSPLPPHLAQQGS